MRPEPILIKRILDLRQFAMFAHAELAELATIAENVVERTFKPDELVAGADRLASLHLVVSGELASGAAWVGPREVHGALEVAARRAARVPTFARARSQTLELSASDYFEILEDNFGLLRSVIRELATRLVPFGTRHRPLAANMRGTGLVERMIVLRHLLPFAATRLEPLAILAHAAVERRWPSGVVVRRPDAPTDTALVVLEGTLRSNDILIRSGQAVGALEALAGLPQSHVLESMTPVRALEIPAATIVDVLEDHTDFALAIVETLAREILDAPVTARPEPGTARDERPSRQPNP